MTLDMSVVHLSTRGWLSWTESLSHLQGCGGLWMAPAGVIECQPGQWPADLPLTTRLHAWDRATGVMWRLVPRASQRTVLLTSLTIGDEVGRRVAVGDTLRLAARAFDDGVWQRWFVGGHSPVTFLRPSRASGAADHE